jgi:hypothetical protein
MATMKFSAERETPEHDAFVPRSMWRISAHQSMAHAASMDRAESGGGLGVSAGQCNAEQMLANDAFRALNEPAAPR